jgi:hypothetical protein
MISGRRRNYKLGGSNAMTYPGDVVVGKEATIAGERLLIIDPQGEINENDLAEFMETHINPAFWKWYRQKEAARRPVVKGVQPLELKTPVAEGVEPVIIQNVETGPHVYLINCWRCGGQISWRVDLGTRGGCPYCGAWCQLVKK